MTRTYTREDVQTHSDGFGRGFNPAVNVKVYGTIMEAWQAFEREEPDHDPRFTLDWIAEHVPEQAQSDVFQFVCENEYEYLEAWATGADGDSLFPDDRVSLSWEGRSGGWIAVLGLPELEEWDAVRLARWRRFERVAREIAAGVPLQMILSIYINQFERWSERQDAEAVYNAEAPVDEALAVGHA